MAATHPQGAGAPAGLPGIRASKSAAELVIGNVTGYAEPGLAEHKVCARQGFAFCVGACSRHTAALPCLKSSRGRLPPGFVESSKARLEAEADGLL